MAYDALRRHVRMFGGQGFPTNQLQDTAQRHQGLGWPAVAQGRTLVTLPIPYWPVLHGYQLFAQAGVLDAASPGGLKLSAGLRFVVGD